MCEGVVERVSESCYGFGFLKFVITALSLYASG